MRAAIVLIEMKVAPVITVHVPFDGDDHFDGDLSKESDETVTGMATFVGLMQGLAAAQLSDRVTYGTLPISSSTGMGDPSGEIASVNSLAAVGKTLGVALGLPRAAIEAIVMPASGGDTAGKVITAAVIEG